VPTNTYDIYIADKNGIDAKTAYNTVTGDKESAKDALNAFAKETKDRQAREAAADSAESKSNSDKNTMRKGGAVRSSASKRADGCAVKGFTRAK
jgi:hypothetical protein